MCRPVLISVLLLAAAPTLPAQQAWPEAGPLRALLTEQGIVDAYDALRGRLGQAGRLYRATRTPALTAALLADPLTAPTTVAALTDRIDAAARAETADLHALLVECARLADLEPPPADLGPDRSAALLARSEDFDERIELAVGLLGDAAMELETALAPLPVEQRTACAAAVLALCDAFVRNVYPTMDEAHAATLRQVLGIDRAAMLRAACHLVPLVDPAFWTPLRNAARSRPSVEAPDGVEGKVLAFRDTPFGKVVVGGFGHNRYDLDAALIVDFAGDDVYAARATRADLGQGLNVVVDLYGDDRYEAATDGHLAQGAALFGVSILADHRGDDRYEAGRIAQGAGVCGLGILLDTDGRDRYAADGYAQGAGLLGFGLLVDTAGDDVCQAAIYSQGFAGPLAVGLLVDGAGDDQRRAGERYPSSYGTAGEFMAMSQGAGIGMRTLTADRLHLAGGVGVLVDGAGDDRSEVGEFGFGIGYFLGTGIVRDRAGNDQVDASRYGIATGAHQAVSVVLDDGGDDRWTNPHTASIAGNWDHTASVLVDLRGDDLYQGAGITLGSATITSFAALIDGGGSDRYEAGGSGLALGTCGHEHDARNQTRCVALFVDEGAGRDVYERAGGEPAPADGLILVRRKEDGFEDRRVETGVGVFADR
jgi:hypothetical protein